MDPIAAAPAIPGLPFEIHTMAAIALGAGLVLWLMGSRVVKPIFAILGLVIGSAMGFIVVPVFGPDQLWGIQSPYIGLGAGAIIGLVGAVIMFRFTIAVASAGVFATASVFGASIYLSHVDAQQTAEALGVDQRHVDTARSLAESELLMEGVRVAGDEASDAITGGDAEPRTPLAATVRDLIGALRAELGEAWRSVPPLDRLVLVGAAAVGGALGLLFGLSMPRRSAALVTALFGSAVALGGVGYFAGSFSLPGREALLASPTRWVVVWGLLAVAGFMFQIYRLHRAKALA